MNDTNGDPRGLTRRALINAMKALARSADARVALWAKRALTDALTSTRAKPSRKSKAAKAKVA